MSTDGVEVSEHRDGPTRIGASQVIEHVLGSQFCPAIGTGHASHFRTLGYRQGARHLIDRCGRTEDNLEYPDPLHGA